MKNQSRDRDVGGGAAGDGPQHEAGGHGDEVEHGDVLEPGE